MKKLKHLLLLASLVGSSLFAGAQTLRLSPFKPVPPPQKLGINRLSVTNDTALARTELSVYRFIGPMAGYDFVNKGIVTGIGYGLSRIHYDNSTQKYVTDLSVYGAAFATGSTVPSIYSNNIISAGIGVSIDNNLINIVPDYNFPLSPGTKGRFGIVFSFSASLVN